MDDTELDDLLATRVQSANPRLETAVTGLVRASRRQVEGTATGVRRRRRRFLVGGVALGAVVLTAGGSLTAARLDLPPFQGLEPGVQRIQAPIHVDYVTASGKDVRCQAFLEFRHLTDDQATAARTYLAGRHWSGFGQQAYDTAVRKAGSSALDPVGDALAEVLGGEFVSIAREAVPGVTTRAPRGDGATFSGYGMSCPTGQG